MQEEAPNSKTHNQVTLQASPGYWGGISSWHLAAERSSAALGFFRVGFLLLWERTDLIYQLNLGVTKLDLVIEQLHSAGG